MTTDRMHGFPDVWFNQCDISVTRVYFLGITFTNIKYCNARLK